MKLCYPVTGWNPNEPLPHNLSAIGKESRADRSPAMNFLMVDGQGDPNRSPVYQEAIGMLYTLAVTIKFLLKRSPNHQEYVVPPPEGLWWIKDGILDSSDKSHWLWTSMIMQPDTVTPEVFGQA